MKKKHPLYHVYLFFVLEATSFPTECRPLYLFLRDVGLVIFSIKTRWFVDVDDVDG